MSKGGNERLAEEVPEAVKQIILKKLMEDMGKEVDDKDVQLFDILSKLAMV